MTHSREYREPKRRPESPTLMYQADEDVHVQIRESRVVRESIENAPEPGRGAAKSRELPIRAIEEIGDDEQRKPKDVDPGIRIYEKVAGSQAHDNRPERDLVG